ncbi:MAG: electron transfer flavoprotein subunit alpha/FixB family protein [Chloroflexi bacterium]|nr:electron transfer flavoprotein subunit alpha/FixB family protein [Chloroflexota bacterium]
MNEILVLAEHRRGELREITFDLIARGRQLAEKAGAELVAVVLGRGTDGFCATLAQYADRVLVVEDDALRDFNSEPYQAVLAQLISERQPLLTLIGHTACGLDLAPSLAVQLDAALVTDCLEVEIDGGKLTAVRPAYGGRVRASLQAREATHRIATIQAGNAPSPRARDSAGEIVKLQSPLAEEMAYKKLLEYVDTAAGEIDISQSEIIVSVGRGIGDPKNITLVEDLANALGGVLACSRPVVDKKWLPKARQVGISGKTVHPKLYLAIGISGAFQHVTAIKGAGMVVAINKDPKAPIFRVADYGIVGDLFAVVPTLKEKIARAKAGK